MKKIEEPKAMKEMHEIRKRIYEETTNMTIPERLAYTRKKSAQVEK